MKPIWPSTLALLSLISVESQANNNRFERVLTANDNRYQLHCELYDRSNFIRTVTPIGQTQFKKGSYLYRQFNLQTSDGNKEFSLQVYASGNTPRYQAKIEGATLQGEVEEGVTNHHKKRMTFRHNLLGKVTCYTEFAYEPNHVLGEGNHHINVHPHSYYDFRNVTSGQTNRYYADSSLKSLMLLEDYSWKEGRVNLVNFLRTGITGLSHRDPGTIVGNVPANADVKVSAAGHNRYTLAAKEKLKITYTGGNHNYCIWNNTRRVFNAIMESEDNPVVEIIYKQDAIVVQRAGIIGGLSFSRWGDIRKTNRLGDLMQKPDVAKGYHQAYFNFFAHSQFGYYSHRFKSLTLTYDSQFYKNRIVIQGSGERHIQIHLKYQ